MFRRSRLPIGERHDVSAEVCDICAQTNTSSEARGRPLYGWSADQGERTRFCRGWGRTVPDVGSVADGGPLVHVLLEGCVRRIGEGHRKVALDRAEPDDHVRPRLFEYRHTHTQRRARVRWKVAAENLGVQSLSLQSWHMLSRGQVHRQSTDREQVYT